MSESESTGSAAEAPESAEAAPAAEAAEAGKDERSTAPAAAANLPTFEATGDALFEALWAKVLAGWDDDKAHHAVLEYSLGAERLPDLAGRYRLLKDDPEKGERAKKRLDAIVIAATQLMMSMRSSTKTTVPLPITLTVAGLFFSAVAFVAYAMLHR